MSGGGTVIRFPWDVSACNLIVVMNLLWEYTYMYMIINIIICPTLISRSKVMANVISLLVSMPTFLFHDNYSAAFAATM